MRPVLLSENEHIAHVTDPGAERLTRKPWITRNMDDGSIELVVIGMLAALIVLLAIPLFSGFEEGQPKSNAQPEQSAQVESLEQVKD